MSDSDEHPNWKPLSAIQRRVVGVLVEKAKTTPDVYPMTVNSIRTASNQKSNRFPQMSLDAEDVEDALYDLREMGAVVEIQGDGRTLKYKHLMYRWLNVERGELAVMTELLLRGAQTIGELRGRASRMEKIADVAELRPLVGGLIEKRLMVALTSEGRGQVVTHNLYQPEELEKLKNQYAEWAPQPAQSAVNPNTGRSVEAQLPASETQQLERVLGELSQIKDLVNSLAERIDKIEQQSG